MTDFTLADGRLVHLIGDPHLGRKFENGVPAHRRGEREVKQAAHFSAELEADGDMIVMVGDLFDNPHVSQFVVVSAANAVLHAAERRPDVTFVMMAGNHDQPRNLGVVGAWASFRRMAATRLPNLYVLDRPAVIGGVAFFPWEWNRNAKDQLSDVAEATGVEHAVGHWDTVAFDGKDAHLVPVAALRAAFGDIGLWTGHIHISGPCEVDGYLVTKTGSLEPYTHGEDPEGRMYVTLSREAALAADDARDKYVRVILAPGEDLPDIDCLGLTHLRARAEQDDEDVTVSIDDFDWQEILRARISALDPAVQAFIKERIQVDDERDHGGRAQTG